MINILSEHVSLLSKIDDINLGCPLILIILGDKSALPHLCWREGRKITIYTPTKCITVCPGSSGPFYIVTYCIKWVTTSWSYSMYNVNVRDEK